MNRSRDDFSEKTKLQIGKRAGWLCPYPTCRTLTFDFLFWPTKDLALSVIWTLLWTPENQPVGRKCPSAFSWGIGPSGYGPGLDRKNYTGHAAAWLLKEIDLNFKCHESIGRKDFLPGEPGTVSASSFA
jgi:hypothetical protein